MDKKAPQSISLMLLLLLASSILSAQTVVNRIRLGNVVEDATYITSGPYAKQFVYLDGYNVMGVQNGTKNSSAQPQKLFDTTKLMPNALAARGVAYIPEKQQFVFTNNLDPYTIYFTDLHGNPTGTLTIQWPDFSPFIPTNVESIRWVGSKDATFPGKFLMVINDNAATLPERNASGQIAVIDGNGVVERLIAPSSAPDYITGFAYLPPDRFFFGLANDDSINVMDISGNVMGTVYSSAWDVEGLTFVDGRILLSLAHGTGRVIAYDANLQRVPSRDRDYAYGFGIDVLHGLGWDNDRFSLVSWGENERVAPFTFAIYSVNPLGLGFSSLFDYGTEQPFGGNSATTYFSNEHLVGVAYPGSAASGFQLVNNSGLFVEDRPTDTLLRAPLTYIAPMNQVAARTRAGNDIELFDASTGALITTIGVSSSLNGAMTGLAYFNPSHPSGGEFLVFVGSTHTAYIFDFNGTLLRTFDTVTTLGIYAPGGVTAMPIANICGLFATYNGAPNEIVEFVMPCN